jgi:hypothetical protein
LSSSATPGPAVRALRREKRRGHRRELRAKVGPRIVTAFSVTLAITGSAAFAIAVVLLTMGELSKSRTSSPSPASRGAARPPSGQAASRPRPERHSTQFAGLAGFRREPLL